MGLLPFVQELVSSQGEQVGSYKCAEDKLECTLDLALLAFQAHPPALIMANKGSGLARCCTLVLGLGAASLEGDFFSV